MINVDKILHALQHDPQTRKTAAAAGAVGAAGLALGMLSGKKGRKLMGGAAKYGAVAALGGLAYHAWTQRQAAQTAPAGADAPTTPDALAPPPQGTPFLPDADTPEADDHARALIRAMIAAAKADGKIDAEEKAEIFKRLEEMDLSADDKAFVFDEISAPLDITLVAAGARTPEHAAEIYAASLVAIEDDTPAERMYLEDLARRLDLAADLVEAIRAQAG